jgi:hypothetical protein
MFRLKRTRNKNSEEEEINTGEEIDVKDEYARAAFYKNIQTGLLLAIMLILFLLFYLVSRKKKV